MTPFLTFGAPLITLSKSKGRYNKRMIDEIALHK
jgi:hypothetical protein